MLDFSRPSKREIKEFLNNNCDEVYDMPDHALELIMDNHKCIRWYGKEYFIPEFGLDNNRDEVIFDHLVDNYGL